MDLLKFVSRTEALCIALCWAIGKLIATTESAHSAGTEKLAGWEPILYILG